MQQCNKQDDIIEDCSHIMVTMGFMPWAERDAAFQMKSDFGFEQS